MTRTNKKWVMGTITLLIVIFASYITYNMVHQYRQDLVTVTEKRIIEGAKKCYAEDVCTGEQTTLAFLYRNNYLTTESNPLTKELYKESSVIKKNGGNYSFIPEY
jgi:threonine dehydratase